MIIGLLVGRENTFPQAFIERVNSKHAGGVTAEMLELNSTSLEDVQRYSVIVDRISHEIPYYRAVMKKAVADGVIVINNPFWWSADDKFFECVVAKKLGVPVPKSVILPNRAYDADIVGESLRNLVQPLDWDAILHYVGLPAVLKPAIGGGNKNISVVRSRDELIEAHDQSGSLLMILQEFIEHQNYVRCFCLGRENILVSRYGHYRAREERYIDGFEGIDDALLQEIAQHCTTLNNALGYDMNTVEMAIRDGVPYAIDFLNPAPDFDLLSIKPKRFEWVVETLSSLVIDFALGTKKPAENPAWQAMISS